jgi:hypothetical protein
MAATHPFQSSLLFEPLIPLRGGDKKVTVLFTHKPSPMNFFIIPPPSYKVENSLKAVTQQIIFRMSKQ